MRRPCLFKERDVKRAGRAVLAMGLQIGRVEIDKNGTIIVVPAETKETGMTRHDSDQIAICQFIP